MSAASFTDAYLTCLAWSSTDDAMSDRHAELTLEELEPDSRAALVADCVAFYADQAELWADGWTDEQAGHDFALTRNGHGAGFWDRYYDGGPNDAAGDQLTDACRPYGTAELYELDDGRIGYEA